MRARGRLRGARHRHRDSDSTERDWGREEEEEGERGEPARRGPGRAGGQAGPCLCFRRAPRLGGRLGTSTNMDSGESGGGRGGGKIRTRRYHLAAASSKPYPPNKQVRGRDGRTESVGTAVRGGRRERKPPSAPGTAGKTHSRAFPLRRAGRGVCV